MESGIFSLCVFKTSLNNIFSVDLPAFRINTKYFATEKCSNMIVLNMRSAQGSYGYVYHMAVTVENSLLFHSYKCKVVYKKQ